MDPHYERRLHGSPITSPVKRIRTQSPLSSPVKENYSDRFIPIRKRTDNDENCPVSLIHKSPAVFPLDSLQPKRGTSVDVNIFTSQHTRSSTQDSSSAASSSGMRHSAASTYTTLITNEMSQNSPSENMDPSYKRTSVLVETENRNTHQYKIPKESPNKLRVPPYTTSPINYKNQAFLKSPRRIMRKVPCTPYKVLDAPDLQDDFYLNLVDWSSSNILAVGLGSCVYLWNAVSSQVTRLCDMTTENDTISSVSWNEKGSQVAVGTYRGIVQIWDASETRMTHGIEGHTARVGSLTWNENSIVSGSRDRTIRIRDVRAPPSQAHSPGGSQIETAARLQKNDRIIKEHKQEVCGLRWSPDKQMLASGGNDNRLMIWSANNMATPLLNYEQHSAAVKAIAWSPHIHGLLASGGGTADKTIRFWNTLTGQPLHFVDTGSQVCNIAWSNHTDEVVSTHGYSQNQILLWSYPSMQQFGKLTGHTFRVLYLSVSPDGENIVTGAGDETLRFWSVFRHSKNSKVDESRLVMLDISMR